MAAQENPGPSNVAVLLQPPPPALPINNRLRDPPLFSGLRGNDVEDWIKNYDLVSDLNRWDNPRNLRSVPFYLSDVAKTWFWNHHPDLPDWETLEQRICQILGAPKVRTEAAKKKLAERTQLPGESYISYIEDVLALWKHVNTGMSQNDQSHIIKGINAVAFNALTTQNAVTTQDVITICQWLDELQSLRLCYDATDIRLPTPLDLRALIRDIVREELHGRWSSCAAEVTFPSEKDSLRDLIKQEIASASHATCSNGPCVCQMRTYAEVAMLSAAPTVSVPTTADHTPVASLSPPVPATSYYAPQRPPRLICYYCG